MSSGYNIKVPDRELRQMYKKAPKVVETEIGRMVKEGTLLVLSTATKEAPADSGRLRGSLDATIKTYEGQVTPGVDYAGKLERGEADETARFEDIQKWARRKGLGQFAYLIFRQIRRDGPKKNPFMARTLKRSKGRVLSFFDEAISKITRGIVK